MKLNFLLTAISSFAVMLSCVPAIANNQEKQSSTQIQLSEEEQAFINSNPVIRVHNENDWPPYNFSRNGKPLGLSIDVMNLIAQKTGLEVEYVTGPTWDQFLGMMQDGSLDVMLNIVKTPERQKYLLYTPPYSDNPNSILSKSEQPYQNIESLDRKTVALPKGFFTEEVLTNKYPQINLLTVNSALESMKAVAFGQADAALGEFAVFNFLLSEHMMSGLEISGEAKMGNPEYSLLNIATRKDMPVLASILTKGVQSISFVEKRHLQNKWVGKNSSDTTTLTEKRIVLTQEEEAYLQSKSSIKMCVNPDVLPYEEIDENGKYQGIGSDVMQLVSKRLNKQMVLVPTQSWAETYVSFLNKQCDILPMAVNTPKRRLIMNFSEPYLKASIVVATNEDEFFVDNVKNLRNKKIGVVKGYSYAETLAAQNRNVIIVDVENEVDGLRRVQNGELFGYVDALPTIAYNINKHGFVDLKIGGVLDFDIKLSVASLKEEPLLHSIIQKALNNISDEEINNAVNKWMTVRVEEKFDYMKLLYASLFFTVIIAIVAYKNRSINKINKQLELMSVTDNLTGLCNRHKLDEVLACEMHRFERFSTSFGIIILDIDHFKRVNDNHGHQMGDAVLKEFANLLSTHSRKTDTVGRWGGEEFMIICSGSSQDGIVAHAEQLREVISSHSFSVGEQKTASFGVAVYENSLGINDMIKRADDHLYWAKENGRNLVGYEGAEA